MIKFLREAPSELDREVGCRGEFCLLSIFGFSFSTLEEPAIELLVLGLNVVISASTSEDVVATADNLLLGELAYQPTNVE